MPDGLDRREKCVFRLALRLAMGFGKLTDGEFGGAAGDLGREGVSLVAQVAGTYLHASVLVTLADAELPAE